MNRTGTGGLPDLWPGGRKKAHRTNGLSSDCYTTGGRLGSGREGCITSDPVQRSRHTWCHWKHCRLCWGFTKDAVSETRTAGWKWKVLQLFSQVPQPIAPHALDAQPYHSGLNQGHQLIEAESGLPQRLKVFQQAPGENGFQVQGSDEIRHRPESVWIVGDSQLIQKLRSVLA